MSVYFTTIYQHADRQNMTRTKIVSIAIASAALLFFIFIFAQTVTQGESIFIREGCANCHSFKGHGGAIAPDLTGVTQRRSTKWIITQISNPRSHNPDSRMPEFEHISIPERFAIVYFLKD